jgi:hypothetical protein
MKRVSDIVWMIGLLCGALVALPVSAEVVGPVNSDSVAVFSEHFATGRVCAMCHSTSRAAAALKDSSQRGIGPHDLWRSSMMAQASVDPLWRAVVASEVAATPSRAAEIETKCLRCHAPMASLEAQFADRVPTRAEFLTGDELPAQLAADGVSCTICHQIDPDGIENERHFNGHFEINNGREIFGPHANPFAMPMFRHTDYMPTEGTHVRDAALCAACHTLFTDALTDDGKATGHTLLEQGPYLEWKNSHFNGEGPQAGEHAASCQHCHVPTMDEDGQEIRTRIARNPRGWDFPPLRPRSPFGRHTFVGGNTLIPAMLRDQLATEGDHDAARRFDLTIAAARNMLREKTAKIQILDAKQTDGRVLITVSVRNLTGHKLPTAYPSRRVWIRLQLFDSAGEVVFASGAFDPRGRILDGSGNALASELVGGPAVPHEGLIESSDQVQIYESVMEDAKGHLTHSLLRGARYRKDNRLLPQGWTAAHPQAALTSPVGTADDHDFLAGTDTVSYVIDGRELTGKLRIEATLCYQVLGSRHAAELLTQAVPEMKAFSQLYATADVRPELLDRDESAVTVNP